MSLPALPLFHRIAGQPVIVLGHGDAAQAKRRLVERAGGQVVEDLAHGIDIGARLAFIAHDNADACMADALRARGAGLLVNVVDRPALCDFTTPSLIDRSPVVVAVGTAGASAGLA
jgi:uroporphyrin-III C-methyltransferase/precorrin-2 dehydrogenase/sirohydrochlorin ferrochelatase